MNILNIIIAIFGFGFLVFIHELGHFFVARLNGVKVEEFSIGMGPTLISKKGRETVWSIKALPLGGACQMKGEDTGKDDPSNDSFQSKSPLRRMSIIAAGPVMNIITAVVLFTVFGSMNGYLTNRIDTVAPDTPAVKAGLMQGDEIVSVGKYKTSTFVDVQTGIFFAGDKPTVFNIRRNGEVKDITITPVKNPETGLFMVGFKPDFIEKPGIFQSVSLGTREMLSMAKQTLYSIGGMITGKVGKDSVSGPVAVIGAAAGAAGMGFSYFLKFLGLLSISLAVFNLLQFPALDGGWLFLLLIELITRRRIPEKYVAVWNGIGFTLLLTLMVLVTFKDIFYPVR